MPGTAPRLGGNETGAAPTVGGICGGNQCWGEEDRAGGEQGEGAPMAGDGVGKARGVFEQEVTCRTIDRPGERGGEKGTG